MPSSAAIQGSATSMRQIGPSARPWRGQSRREVHGVRMTPMKASPASNDLGASTATSFRRTSFSLTMIPTRSFASGGLVAARLGFHRLAALEARQKLVMRHRLREHGIVLLDRGLLLFLADGRRAVLERDDVIALLVSGPHRRLDATIGQEPA